VGVSNQRVLCLGKDLVLSVIACAGSLGDPFKKQRVISANRYLNLCWLLGASVRINREYANLCFMKTQGNALANREKNDVSSVSMEGKQGNEDKKTQES
jgi:hypothetical protein